MSIGTSAEILRVGKSTLNNLNNLKTHPTPGQDLPQHLELGMVQLSLNNGSIER